MTLSARHTTRQHYTDPDPEDPSICMGKKTERSLTLYPHPENVASIRRLLDMYRFDIEIIEEQRTHENMTTLTTAALFCDLPRNEDHYKPDIQDWMNKSQEFNKQWTGVVMRTLRERAEALQEMLFMVNRPQLFQEKMEAFKSRFAIA